MTRSRNPMDLDVIRSTPTLREWVQLFKERRGRYPNAAQHCAYLEEHPEQVQYRRSRR